MQKNVFLAVENHGAEALYKTWLEASEDNRYDVAFQKLFIELEEAIGKAMDTDRSDRHSRTERGWTPPPKGYADPDKLNQDTREPSV